MGSGSAKAVSAAELATGAEASCADAAAAITWLGACAAKGSLNAGRTGAWDDGAAPEGTLSLPEGVACTCLRSELTSSHALVESTSSSSAPASSEPSSPV